MNSAEGAPSSSQQPQPPHASWRAGQTRVQDKKGHVGTVVYVGPVVDPKGSSSKTYVGVVWNDARRGKHTAVLEVRTGMDSVVKIRIPTGHSASLVPPAKLISGRSLTAETVYDKYPALRGGTKENKTDSPEKPLSLEPSDVASVTSSTTSSSRRIVETTLVTTMGTGKGQVPVQLLTVDEDDDEHEASTVVSLPHCGLSSIDAGSLRTLNLLTELDLSDNLFCDWSSVATLLQALPGLQSLTLSGNRLGSLLDHRLPRHESLRQLNLHCCGLSLLGDIFSTTIQRLTSSLVALEEICLAHNNGNDEILVSESKGGKQKGGDGLVQSTDPDSESSAEKKQDEPNRESTRFAECCRLRVLDVSACQLSSEQLEQWATLGDHGQLKTLMLNHNPIDRLDFLLGSSSEGRSPFASLEHLFLSHTQLSSWLDLEAALNQTDLPPVTTLRLQSCPLVQGLSAATARRTVVARVPALTCLNGAPISERERYEAELHYVITLFRQEQSSSEESLSLRQEHPQYTRLAVKYKDQLERIEVQQHPTNHNENSTTAIIMVTVTIRSMAVDSCTQAAWTRALPAALTVRRLKRMCQEHFGLPARRQVLLHKTAAAAFPMALDQGDDETLAYYGVCDGDELLMNERQHASENEGGVEEDQTVLMDRRIQEQEQEMLNFQERVKRSQGGGTISSTISTKH